MREGSPKTSGTGLFGRCSCGFALDSPFAAMHPFPYTTPPPEESGLGGDVALPVWEIPPSTLARGIADPARQAVTTTAQEYIAAPSSPSFDPPELQRSLP